MIRLSVYTGTAIVFYLIGIATNAQKMGDYYAAGIKILVDGQSQFLPLKGLSVIVVTMNIILALRLYLHAWIIDESVDYKKNIKKKRFAKRSGEWICRLIWIAGVSWLPSAYSDFPRKIGSIKIHVHYFIFVILLFLCIWDFISITIIKSYSKQKIKDLNVNWIRLDLIMLIIMFLSSLLIEVIPIGKATNWLSIFTPLGYCLIGAICSYQLIVWGRGIYTTAKISEIKSV